MKQALLCGVSILLFSVCIIMCILGFETIMETFNVYKPSMFTLQLYVMYSYLL